MPTLSLRAVCVFGTHCYIAAGGLVSWHVLQLLKCVTLQPMQDNLNLNVMHIHHQLFDVPANLQRQAASQVHQPRLQVGLNLTEDGQSFCEY